METTVNNKIIYPKIGGWLWLPVISIIVSMFQFLKFIFMAITHREIFDIGLNYITLLYNLIIIIYIVLISILFFRRKSITSGLFVILWLFWMAMATFIMIHSSNYLITQQSSNSVTYQFFGSIVGGLIFIPFFIYSKRVKSTFTLPLNTKDSLENLFASVEKFVSSLEKFLWKRRKLLIPGIIIYEVIVIVLSIFISAFF
ncbi:MAG: DUF2569 family protein [Bacteroidales bacterium]|jgi:hypothetical protein|nr:DUF2569 family protein [Bacteroidales bacterium]